ncbi:MAG: 30S ribosomal protein S5 [Candidatus Pacebacteria bacterium]|nr:30S ribosomal protein S5 [Candidatus Paceibacterota bacterium]PIR64049.1 MAG: 30S ribosomal protein S5 [Candidatus Pacebacteria bacterium CG10_big_fil_rev_8_21_14_0_10_40_26]PIZ78153.1 MAG: 30S ribosomal protein S5 [Candidatus Pacebacteria bacterium CG_4_10_14_0_2_um_filter_40_20]PJA69125.1 MAG: 30S ribosomal protein S5 [Candidatus Pacebacteria bacterium CG_4_9_14_3_um_filter_40_12]PJC41742.1 MAG: 30S ribosomal protein S5 [Candidatus Pacebacteria bacterium CG_4_9_14_0_2_um_filter_40_15]
MRTNKQQEPKEFEEKVIQISRVSKKTKGGNNVGFSVLMVVGDRKGRVGVGLGKAKDVVSAIRKGIKKAKKKLITVPLNGTTIPFAITVKKGAGRVMLKPAPQGSGVIAGGPVRAVVEAAGVRDISSKILGSENQASSVYATFEALTQIQKIVELKGIKLKSIADVEAEEASKQKELQEKHAKRAESSEESSDKKSPANKVAKKPVKKAAAKAEAKTVAKPKVAQKAEKKVAEEKK